MKIRELIEKAVKPRTLEDRIIDVMDEVHSDFERDAHHTIHMSLGTGVGGKYAVNLYIVNKDTENSTIEHVYFPEMNYSLLSIRQAILKAITKGFDEVDPL